MGFKLNTRADRSLPPTTCSVTGCGRVDLVAAVAPKRDEPHLLSVMNFASLA